MENTLYCVEIQWAYCLPTTAKAYKNMPSNPREKKRIQHHICDEVKLFCRGLHNFCLISFACSFLKNERYVCA